MSETPRPATPSFGEALVWWLKLGFLSFGGPAGQIALMHHELVERRRWISEKRFLHALNFCMLLPGPEAQQLATYVGWLLHGTPGGLVAVGLFVLPGVVALLALSAIYVGFAVSDGRVRVIAVETGVAFAFVLVGAAAVTGTPWLLVAGFVGHGLKDLWQHRTHFVANTRWWPPFCLVVDFVAGAVIAVLLLSGVRLHG